MSGELATEIVFDADAPTGGPIGPSDVLPVLLRTSSRGWYGQATVVLQP